LRHGQIRFRLPYLSCLEFAAYSTETTKTGLNVAALDQGNRKTCRSETDDQF
jgi:hypothetical protein